MARRLGIPATRCGPRHDAAGLAAWSAGEASQRTFADRDSRKNRTMEPSPCMQIFGSSGRMPKQVANVLMAVIVLFAVTSGRDALAAPDPEAARSFIVRLSEQTFEVLRQPGRTRDMVQTAFRELLRSSFDTYTIARFVLGRYWNSATPAQQREYLRLLEDMVVLTYARRFDQYHYSGETLQVGTVHPEGNNDVTVDSQVTLQQRPPLKVSWRLRERNGQFRIIDIAVEGISLMVTQRSEFSSLIERNGGRIEALLDALRARIAAAEQGS